MTEKDLDEFEKEFGFKLLPTSFKKPLSEITKEEYRERIEYLWKRLETLHERLRKPFIYRLALKYGLITEHKDKVVFYFEKEKEND